MISIKQLNALELEIDRDRSQLGIFGDFVAKIGSILGESAERAEPVRKWVDSIARLIWGAQMKERVETLPTPSPKREIPAPPKRIGPPKDIPARPRQTNAEDEIPF
jgi:hypothetical protein